LDVSGWVASSRPLVDEVKLSHGRRVFARLPATEELASLAGPQPEGVVARGFAASFGTLTLPPQFELALSALIEGEGAVALATIAARRAPLETGFRPRFRPLMVSTYGRTGSRAFLQLLGAHPQVLAYMAPRFEPKVASYWIEILRALAEPNSYLRQMSPGGLQGRWWLGRETPSLWQLPDDQVQDWLGRDAVEQLALVCQERIDALNIKLAERSDRPGAVYFAEKFTVSTAPSLMWELYPGAREVFLVRDFRDMVASVLAFNEKKGRQAFGRDRAESDDQFVRRLGRYTHNLLADWEQRSARAHLVRYEDMIRRPGETVNELLAYLELDSSEANVRAMTDTVGYTPAGFGDHSTSPDVEASIGRWRQDLDDGLQRACLETFGDALETFGYAVER
jgi:hypothetical protein